jgi:hypothetical protein
MRREKDLCCVESRSFPRKRESSLGPRLRGDERKKRVAGLSAILSDADQTNGVSDRSWILSPAEKPPHPNPLPARGARESRARICGGDLIRAGQDKVAAVA